MARSPKAPSRLTVGIPQPERWGGAALTHSKCAKSRVWGVWICDNTDIFFMKLQGQQLRNLKFLELQIMDQSCLHSAIEATRTLSSDPLNYGWTSILTLMNIYEIWQKTQIEHVVLNCDHLIERDGWSGGNNDVKGSMAMSGGLQSGVQHCRCSGYLCCSLYCTRRYLAMWVQSRSLQRDVRPFNGNLSKKQPCHLWLNLLLLLAEGVDGHLSLSPRQKTLLKDRSLKTVEP